MALFGGIRKRINDTANRARAAVATVTENTRNAIENAVNRAVTAAENARTAVETTVNRAATAVGTAAENARSAVESTVNRAFNRRPERQESIPVVNTIQEAVEKAANRTVSTADETPPEPISSILSFPSMGTSPDFPEFDNQIDTEAVLDWYNISTEPYDEYQYLPTFPSYTRGEITHMNIPQLVKALYEYREYIAEFENQLDENDVESYALRWLHENASKMSIDDILNNAKTTKQLLAKLQIEVLKYEHFGQMRTSNIQDVLNYNAEQDRMIASIMGIHGSVPTLTQEQRKLLWGMYNTYKNSSEFYSQSDDILEEIAWIVIENDNLIMSQFNSDINEFINSIDKRLGHSLDIDEMIELTAKNYDRKEERHNRVYSAEWNGFQ